MSTQQQQTFQHQQQQHMSQFSRQVAKVSTATAIGGTLVILSCLTLAATVVGIVLATPLIVIFSPVLVPAVITLFLIASGFIASGGFGTVAGFVFYWMYGYLFGKHPVGADRLDQVRDRIAGAATEIKDRAQQQFTSAS
ncbi:oleosin L-like [Impatiens glandulifera]|uniref:oleosin L-like n=1 Tax=Impatiens glandulifera TaxID=253017 RepID=UPI001FB08E7E|nr:oleosin L-like [Impatiens glandulifera]